MARNDESRIQAAIVDYIRTVAPRCLVFSVPNGGLRTRAEAALFKWTGVVAGIPDLVVLAPGAVALFIEVKTGGGRLSEAQRGIIGIILDLGFCCEVCWSIPNVRDMFRRCGIETREAA